MSWDVRRLAMAIESAAIVLAAAALVITGWWWLAAIAVGFKLFDGLCMTYDWVKHGSPRK